MIATLRGRRRLEPLRQGTNTDCAAACLTMVLRYWGQARTVREVREVMSIGRDGASMAHIVRAAQECGLEASGWAVPFADLGAVPLPAIAHWHGRHFVVVEQVRRGRCCIVDPGVGRCWIGAEEARSEYSGRVALVQPEDPDDAPVAVYGRGPLARLWNHAQSLAHARSLAAGVLAFSTLLAGMGLVAPLLTKLMVDRIAGRAAVATVTTLSPQTLSLGRLAQFVVLVIAMRALASIARGELQLRWQAVLDAHISTRFVRHVFRLPLAELELRGSNDLVQRLDSNATVREVLSGAVVSMVLDGVLTIVYGASMVVYSPPLAAATIATAALLALLSGGLARIGATRVSAQWTAHSRAHGFLLDHLRALKYIRAAALESTIVGKWASLFEQQVVAGMSAQRVEVLTASVLGTITFAQYPLLLLYGMSLVNAHALSLGALFGFLSVATAFGAPFGAVLSVGQRFKYLDPHLERLDEILDCPVEEASDEGGVALSGGVTLHDASYRYSKYGLWALRGVSFEAVPGEFVAIVGRSGSGKSTLASLMLGLLRAEEGVVSLGGLPAHALTQQQRRQVGVVLQEAHIFSASMRTNLTLLSPDASDAAVLSAVDAAQLRELLDRMPMGLDTVVSEDGGNLSGGERQRVAIARALLSRPRVLVLDEATSQLDAETEAAVFAALKALRCTLVVIAHRLSAIRSADRIIVLEAGTMVEQGTHEQLLRSNSRYESLVRAQLATSDGTSGQVCGGRRIREGVPVA